MKTVLFCTLCPLLALGGTIVLEPSKDTTLYEDVGGPLGNGAGSFLFVGRTNQPPPIGTTSERGQLRRALLQFPLDNILPAGAQIVSAKLEVTVSKVPSLMPQTTVRVHQVTNDWGEGTSNASAGEGAGILPSLNDATWSERFFDQSPPLPWITPGGDHVIEASAETEIIGQDIRYEWTSTGLVADLTRWISGTTPNYGWILIGDESTTLTAKRLNSRENPTPSSRPRLTINYLFPSTILNVSIQADRSLEVQFSTVATQAYALESSTDLATWTTLPAVQGNGQPITMSSPTPNNATRLFVRIVASSSASQINNR